jgi:maleate cis-trans isomerase
MNGWRARLGFLVPAGTPTAEDEMFALAPAGVGVHFERMVGHGATGTLEGLEARIATQVEHLPASFRLLAQVKPQVIALAHTATSYHLGKDGEAAMKARLEEPGGPRFTSAFASVIEALRVLGVRRIALATPYDERLTLSGKTNLEAHGLEVVRFDWLRQVRSIFEEPPHRVHALARSVDTPEAEAIFLSGIGMPTVSVIQEIEDDLGKPVISSASAMMWNCLRLAGVSPSSVAGSGRLFEEK